MNGSHNKPAASPPITFTVPLIFAIMGSILLFAPDVGHSLFLGPFRVTGRPETDVDQLIWNTLVLGAVALACALLRKHPRIAALVLVAAAWLSSDIVHLPAAAMFVVAAVTALAFSFWKRVPASA